MSGDLIPIPKEFWANFGEDFVQEMVNPDNPFERRRLYADGRQTYENWLAGDFAVWFPGGDTKQVSGAMLNRAEVERVFPRDRDGAEGGDANAAPVPQDRQARAEGIAKPLQRKPNP